MTALLAEKKCSVNVIIQINLAYCQIFWAKYGYQPSPEIRVVLQLPKKVILE